MSSADIWLVVALFCIGGIVLALLQINRVMDFSRTYFGRWNREERGDEGGIWTPLNRGERKEVHDERVHLRRNSVPESTLRADLPPGTTIENEETPPTEGPGLTQERPKPPEALPKDYRGI